MARAADPRTEIALLEQQEARRPLSGSGRGRGRTDRQAAGRLLEAILAKAGIDLEPLRAPQSQRPAARGQIAQIGAEAEQASAAQSSVDYAIAAWRADIGTLTTLEPPPRTQRLLLDTAAAITTTPGLGPVTSHVGPQANSVQFRLRTTKESAFEQVDFGFLWQNPSDQFALVSVDGYLVLNGICQILVNGGVGLGDIFGDASSDIQIDAWLRIHQLWNALPTSPTFQPSQFHNVLALTLGNPGPFSAGDIVRETLFRGFDFQYSGFAVPPRATAGFEILCELRYDNDDGEVDLNFAGQGRQLLCPGILLTVLT